MSENSLGPLRKGFTLVELLVVIAIIGVLVALLLPAVQSAREAARRIQCQNNLKQIGLAILNAHDIRKEFPKGVYSHPTDGHPYDEDGLGWLTKCLPYLEEAAVYDQIADANIPMVSNPWDPGIFARAYAASVLIPGGNRVISALLCPSVSLPSHVPAGSFGGSATNAINTGYATAHYKGSRGYCDRGIFLRQAEAEKQQACWKEVGGQWIQIIKRPFKRVRLQDIRDGTSKTVLAGESAYYLDNIEWPIWVGSPNSDEVTLFKTNSALNCNIRVRRFPLTAQEKNEAHGNDCALSWHVGGVQFVFCDGSVHFIQDAIELQTFNNLGDRADGEILGDFL